MDPLAETRKQLRQALGYSMTADIAIAITEALQDDAMMKPLFLEYYENTLKHFGVKRIKFEE